MQIQNDIGKITTIVNFLFHPSHIYLDLLLLEPGTSLGVISSQEFRYVFKSQSFKSGKIADGLTQDNK